MSEKKFNQDEINKLINSAWDKKSENELLSLRQRFENRLTDLGITSNQVEQNLQVAYRTLNGILDGDLLRFDLLSLLKVGHFLEIPENEIMEMYTKFVAEKHKEDLDQAKKSFHLKQL